MTVKYNGKTLEQLAKEPHLAFLAGAAGARGEWTMVPPGFRMAIITDPNRQDGVLPLQLLKVSNDRLEFVILTDKFTRTSQRLVFRATKEGTYDSTVRDDANARKP